LKSKTGSLNYGIRTRQARNEKVNMLECNCRESNRNWLAVQTRVNDAHLGVISVAGNRESSLALGYGAKRSAKLQESRAQQLFNNHLPSTTHNRVHPPAIRLRHAHSTQLADSELPFPSSSVQMASTGVNVRASSLSHLLRVPYLTLLPLKVLRWAALGFGVLYGVTKQSSISSRDRMAAAKAEWDHKASLISEAKAEFNKKNNPEAAKAAEKKSAGAGFDSMCTLSSKES
jgi:F-type H+-transporting ATP synthase subunit e